MEVGPFNFYSCKIKIMENLNKKFDLQIEVLTPLNVGAGAEKDWIKGADFIVDDNKVKIINLRKAAQFVPVSELTIALLEKNSVTLKTKLGNNITHCVERVFEGNYFGNNDIKTHIKNQLSGNPIIPGSSLKGAIRSILFQYLGCSSKDGKEFFGSSTKGDEFMRFVKVADTEFDNSTLVNSKIYNLKRQGNNFLGAWKHGFNNTTQNLEPDKFNTFFEALMPQQRAFTTISISEKGYKNFEKIGSHEKGDKKRTIVENDISYLFQIINQHTKKYIKKQIQFFEKYSNNESHKIIISLNKILDQIPDDNSSCVLKMSAGSGFHSITGDWQFDNFSIDGVDTTRTISQGTLNRKRSAKSRKIAIYNNTFYLMGFVKLQVVDGSKIEEERKRIKEQEEKNRLEQKKNENKKREFEEKLKQPETRDFNTLKDGDIVDAKVVGQEGVQCVVELFLDNLSSKTHRFRFPAGFETGTIISCSINFPNRNNRNQFNLMYKKTKMQP